MKGQQISSTRISSAQYRDKIDIVSDILLKLVEYGELNQTALVSFCGLNLTKHRSIIEKMEALGLIKREIETMGKARLVSHFKASPQGLEFLRQILEPYAKMFPYQKD